MRIELNARNYKVSDRLREIIEKKMEKFSRYFEDDAVAKITMREIKNNYAMEITIFFGGGNMVRSEVISDNMYNNIDLALPKIEGQIRKHRTKLGKKIRQAALDEASIYAPAPAPEKNRELVRTKTIELKKINVAEALDEMELVDHDFFIFLNDKTGLVNVVYRRADGNAGLIELVY
ncbi:MAG TPA: ribosome-associated translation inhibitor RaiA [Candidatus Ornithoclostridium excrementipullorum]|nr:ribosome-associated translation inhibitor RaiA [Candidatus Ornithoclostridium excrementipullorum]